MLEFYLAACGASLEWWKSVAEATHRAHTETVVRLPIWRGTHLHAFNPNHWAPVIPLRPEGGALQSKGRGHG